MKIELEGAVNVRDLGGITGADGKKVRNNLFIRSAAVGALTENDIRTLKEDHNLSTVIDLRTGVERKDKPDTEIEGVENLHMPIFKSSKLGITHENELTEPHMIKELIDMYPPMVEDEFSSDQLINILNTIIDGVLEDRGAVLYHCTVGKDRTGVVSLMILSALGVSKEDIMEDYITTNIYAVPEAQKMREDCFNTYGDQALADKLYRAFIADESYLETIYTRVGRKYGTIYNYILKRLAIPEEKLQAFREKALA